MTATVGGNLLAPELARDPHPFLESLREEQPVYWSEWWNGWFITRYADIEALLKRHDVLSADTVSPAYAKLSEPDRACRAATFRMLSRWLPLNDAPDHTRLRRLINKAFTPRALERMGPRVAELADELLRDVTPGSTIELKERFSRPLTRIVIAELLGVPHEDLTAVNGWADDIFPIVHGDTNDPGRQVRAEQGFAELQSYFEQLAETRRAEPREDLISALVSVAEEGDGRLSRLEVSATCILTIFAGLETTTGMITNGTYALLSNPEQLALFAEHPELGRGAVEELLRYYGTAFAVTRRVTADFEHGPHRFRAGQKVLLILASGNRDTSMFEDPHRFDIRRSPNHHIAFGGSIHFCVGAALGRLETRIALEVLFSRFPDLRLASDTPHWVPTIITRDLQALDVVCGSAADPAGPAGSRL